MEVYEHGHAIVELCLQLAEPLSESDVILMHKLMIEANEQEYLQKSNHFAPGTFSPQAGFFEVLLSAAVPLATRKRE